MQTLLHNFKIIINPKIYVKDPETSVLGKKIIEHGILLIDEIGFENFTFKKLGERIGSNESSIYRYFENKHKLLIYLSSWYWSWMEYKLVFNITNVNDAQEKLRKAIAVITDKIEDDSNTEHINEAVLNKIIITEFTKTLHTKEIDAEIKAGFYLIYDRIINRIVSIINEVNPNYPFAKCLVSSMVEGSLHQHFLKEHFASITDYNANVTPSDFYANLITTVVKN